MHGNLAVVLVMALCVTASHGDMAVRGAEPKFPEWVEWHPSPHHSVRTASQITAIICHYTAGGNLSGAVTWFQDPASKVSAHYVIGKDGQVVQMVALDRAAWHAGASELAGVANANAFSIGIEIVNWGKLTKKDGKFYTYTGQRYQGAEPVSADGAYWEPYTKEQYQAVIRLASAVLDKYPLEHITGHGDVARPKGRKIDPGPAFDWQRVSSGLPRTYVGQVGTLSR